MLTENQDDDVIEEIPSEEEDTEIESGPIYKILNYGADYTLGVIADKLRKEDIIVPSFQRRYVWNINKASKLIESFLLGLPVPQVFLFKEMDTERLLVVDGQQRLKTIQFFFDETFIDGKEFKLKYVHQRWLNKTFSDLSDADKRLLENSILRATIFQQTHPDDNKSVFEVFERLNTGGMLLNSQEIRNCIIQGRINVFLDTLNKYKTWRVLFSKTRLDHRMRDIEMILRFLALYEDLDRYYKPMKEFLTEFMRKNKDISVKKQEYFENIFKKTIDFIYKEIGVDAFKIKRGINVALMDAVTVSIAKLGNNVTKDIKTKYRELINDEALIESVSVHTTDTDKVQGRIRKAIEVFSK